MSELSTLNMGLTGLGLVLAGLGYRRVVQFKDELMAELATIQTALFHAARRARASADDHDVDRAWQDIIAKTVELEAAIERLRGAAAREVPLETVETVSPTGRKIVFQVQS
jgi:hypothetical protein